MAAVAIPGQGYPIYTMGPPFGNAGMSGNGRILPGVAGGAASTMDLAAEKFAMLGRICLAGRSGTKTLSAAGGGSIVWLPVGVTFANATTSLDVGLQGITANSNDPDGVYTVKATLTSSSGTPVSATLCASAMGTGSKTVTHNEAVALVWDMTARGGADSVVVAFATASATAIGNSFCQNDLAVGSWSPVAGNPNALIIFDDGTLGWFYNHPLRQTTTQLNTSTYNSGTASFDEYGFSAPIISPTTIEAVTMPVQTAGGTSDWELCIYSDISGTPTLVQTATAVDADFLGNPASPEGLIHVSLDTPVNLATGTYGFSARPTTANNISFFSSTYGSNAQLGMFALGTGCHRIKRLNNTGAFTLENTIAVGAILWASKVPNDAGGGGSTGGKFIGG